MEIFTSKLNPRNSLSTNRRLRILSYNIQVGIPYSRYRHYVTRSWKHVLPFHGRQATLDGIASFLSGFDIVGLQEADAGSLRSNYINQIQYLAHRVGFSHWYAQTNRNLGRLAQHSLGLLSHQQPNNIREIKLPGRIPGRGFLVAEFSYGSESIMFGIVHLALGRRGRAHQLAYIADQLECHRHWVLMGDFNCRCEDPEFRTFIEDTELCCSDTVHHTYPSWRPKHALDHILVTSELSIKNTKVFKADYSDHLPIAIEISLPEEFKVCPTVMEYEPFQDRIDTRAVG